MDYKKKYEDAIERCKKEFNFNNLAYSHEEIKEKLERVFPELKDNEDEKIRKEIIQSIKDNMIVIHKDKCIAWLEKQGEKKLTEKVKPKFKVGDIIRYKNSGTVFTIKSVFSDHYSLTSNEGLLYFMFQDKYELVEQKPAWSEEDEKISNAIYESIDFLCLDFSEDEVRNWLESLKERMKGE